MITRYDDIQGNLVTATGGGATWTNRYLRASNNFPAYPHLWTGDIFAMTFQMPHRKQLDSPVKGIHLHYVPTGINGGTGEPTYGSAFFSLSWGWFNHGDIITSLPNTIASIELAIPNGNLFKLGILDMAQNLAAPTDEDYSSILMVRCERLAAGNVYTGEIALVYMDAHIPVDRQGSINEYDDEMDRSSESSESSGS